MRKLLTDYGMILVLIALCALFSILTIRKQAPTGAAAAADLTERAKSECGKADAILVVGATNKPSADMATVVGKKLRTAGFIGVRTVVGEPRDVRLALDDVAAKGKTLAAIVTSGEPLKWIVIERVPETHPSFADYRLIAPEAGRWPTFLKRSNLLAIVDRIVVIAIVAIGMTMVIITAGIDLSVGSLIALSGMIGTLAMKHLGASEAGPWVVLFGFAVGTLSCGVIGAAGGLIVANFRVPPFITTLGVMLMARGMAFMIVDGATIDNVPPSLAWLGQGRSWGVPNTVLLLVVLFVVAHVFMSHTRLGRYIYAVGGNEQAARLSGVPVKRVIVFVYVVSALAAGLGGCIQTSQLNAGAPNICMMYELYVIAAVVVGGTSLAGGSGRILGTLIGAFIISVIQNGMNLLGMRSYTQQVVLGGVILGAVLLDRMRGSAGLTALLTTRTHPKRERKEA